MLATYLRGLRRPAQGLSPAWRLVPIRAFSALSRLGPYDRTYRRSIEDPNGFWSYAAEEVEWFQKPTVMLDVADKAKAIWFPDGTLNTCHNCLDRHVNAGRGDDVALIHHSSMTKTRSKFTYKEMLDQVSRLAGAMVKMGVQKGDRVLLYMPMIPEVVTSMLACARIGAVHSVVFGGFGALELASRIDHAKPKLIMAGSCSLEPKAIVNYQTLIDQACEIASHAPDKVIYKQREEMKAVLKPDKDLDWDEVLSGGQPHDAVELHSTDPLYILYTSGTTGAPKGILRDNGGHCVALPLSFKTVCKQAPGDVFWAASDVGWIVGHTFTVYAPFISGVTSLLHEGKPVGTPDAGEWWRVIEEHKVTGLYTSPTAIRTILREDPEGSWIKKADLSSLRAVFAVGERLDPTAEHYIEKQLKVPIVDNYWQTESGWPMAANPMGLQQFPTNYGSAGKAMPGWVIDVLDHEGKKVGPFDRGELAVKLPLPPGALQGLYLADDMYRQSYLERYPGYYRTGDSGYKDDEGNYFVMARTDDVINVAGLRLSTGAIEEVLNSHPSVGESAVFGVKDSIKGQVPVGVVLPKRDVSPDDYDRIEQECVKLVRERIGPVAAFKTCRVIQALPKTRSGKILRGTMKKMAQGEKVKVPPTIEEPSALDAVAIVLKDLGLGQTPTMDKP